MVFPLDTTTPAPDTHFWRYSGLHPGHSKRVFGDRKARSRFGRLSPSSSKYSSDGRDVIIPSFSHFPTSAVACSRATPAKLSMYERRRRTFSLSEFGFHSNLSWPLSHGELDWSANYIQMLYRVYASHSSSRHTAHGVPLSCLTIHRSFRLPIDGRPQLTS